LCSPGILFLAPAAFALLLLAFDSFGGRLFYHHHREHIWHKQPYAPTAGRAALNGRKSRGRARALRRLVIAQRHTTTSTNISNRTGSPVCTRNTVSIYGWLYFGSRLVLGANGCSLHCPPVPSVSALMFVCSCALVLTSVARPLQPPTPPTVTVATGSRCMLITRFPHSHPTNPTTTTPHQSRASRSTTPRRCSIDSVRCISMMAVSHVRRVPCRIVLPIVVKAEIMRMDMALGTLKLRVRH
jgi:hypothetical protein